MGSFYVPVLTEEDRATNMLLAAFEHWKIDHENLCLFRDEHGAPYIVNRLEYSIASDHKLECIFRVKSWHISFEKIQQQYFYDGEIIKKR